MPSASRYPDLPVILLTAWTHLESAVQLVKAGAADYVAKPWDNDRLLATVENLLELSESTHNARAAARTARAARAAGAAVRSVLGACSNRRPWRQPSSWPAGSPARRCRC